MGVGVCGGGDGGGIMYVHVCVLCGSGYFVVVRLYVLSKKKVFKFSYVLGWSGAQF